MTPMSFEFLTMQAVWGAACKEKGGEGERGRIGAGAVKREGEIGNGGNLFARENGKIKLSIDSQIKTESR
jgi:hypothetical protein